MSFKIAFKKSVARDLKRIDKDQADRILEKIEKLKCEILPNLETIYAQNNFKYLRYDDDLNLI